MRLNQVGSAAHPPRVVPKEIRRGGATRGVAENPTKGWFVWAGVARPRRRSGTLGVHAPSEVAEQPLRPHRHGGQLHQVEYFAVCSGTPSCDFSRYC